MTIENTIVMIIWILAALVYTWLAIKAEKSRVYYEKQARKATEVLEQLTKLWGSSATTHKKVTKCENCHENTAMATVDHKLLCKSCYEQIEVEK
jgi:hypothetical protein